MGNTPQNSGREAGRRAGEAARRAHPWIERLARFGYAAKGTVYLVTGALTVGVATGAGGRATDQRGALEEIGAQYFGRVLLGLIAVGLVGYVVWRLVQVAADPDGEGRNARGIARRIGYGLSAAVYAGLALTAGRLALASGGDGGGSPQDWTAWLLSWPLGWVLVAGVGAGVAGYGVHQLYQAYEAEFRQYLELGRMSARVETWITRGGRFGLVGSGGSVRYRRPLPRIGRAAIQPERSRRIGRRVADAPSTAFRGCYLGRRSVRACLLRAIHARGSALPMDLSGQGLEHPAS